MTSATSRNLALGLSARITLSLAVALPAHAQSQAADEPDLEQVTVTATRLEMPVNSAPATVSVISSATIEDQLAQSVKDLIRYEPGVSVRASPARFTAALGSTGRDGDSGFNIRGLEGNRVLIQVDGVRMPEAFSFGAQAVGRGDYVDLDILRSVEILRGPASALYGSDGLAGAVSFITKDPRDLLREGQSVSLTGRAAYASVDDSHAESVLGAGRSGPWEVLLAYTRRDGHGRDTRGDNDASNLDRNTPNPEDDASNTALAKLIFEASETQRLRFTWDHEDRDTDWNVLSAVAKPPLSPTSTLALSAHDEIERNRFTLDHQYRGAGIIDTLRTAIYLQECETSQFSSEDRNISPDRTRLNTFNNRVKGATIEAVSSIEGAIHQRFVYGGDYSVTTQRAVRDGTVPPLGETFPTRAFPTTDYTLAGLFVQDELAFGDGRLVLYPAVRWNHYELDPKPDALFVASTPARQRDSHVSPKLGAVLKVNEEWNIFANAARGFKAPSPSEVNNGFANLIANYTSIANPDLKPETSETVEAGIRFQRPTSSASLTGFTGHYKDFIEQIQVGGTFSPTDPGIFQFVNLQNVRITGVEARGRTALSAGFAFSASASYTRGHYDAADGVSTPLETIDPWKLNAGLDWKASSGAVGAQLNATYSHGKEASRAGELACSPSCFLSGSFTVADLLAWWRLTPQLTLRAGVFNLTDKKYWWWGDVRGLADDSPVRDAYSQPGRNASVSLTARF